MAGASLQSQPAKQSPAGEAEQIPNIKGCWSSLSLIPCSTKQPREGEKPPCRYTGRSKVWLRIEDSNNSASGLHLGGLLARHWAGLEAKVKLQHHKNKASASPL